MFHDEKPLDNRELRIVRGMIDDHEYDRLHDRERAHFWTTTKVVVATIIAVWVTVLQTWAAIYTLIHHG